jgi:nucleoside-diphosphate kinase
MIRITRDLAERHYAEHKGKEFFEDVVGYITSGPVIVAVLAGPSAVTVVRQMLGATDGRKAPPGTIRGDFSISTRYNLVHGSDSPESAEREVTLFFKSEELLQYDRDVLKWVWQQ